MLDSLKISYIFQESCFKFHGVLSLQSFEGYMFSFYVDNKCPMSPKGTSLKQRLIAIIFDPNRKFSAHVSIVYLDTIHQLGKLYQIFLSKLCKSMYLTFEKKTIYQRPTRLRVANSILKSWVSKNPLDQRLTAASNFGNHL